MLSLIWMVHRRCATFKNYLSILELALQQQQALPRRHFQTLEEFKKYLPLESEIITDVTEIGTERQ